MLHDFCYQKGVLALANLVTLRRRDEYLFQRLSYPLLGLFTKIQVHDKYVPWVCIISPVLSYILNLYSEDLLAGYKFGFEILMVNGAFTFIGLLLLRKNDQSPL